MDDPNWLSSWAAIGDRQQKENVHAAWIDDQELSLREFGRLLRAYNGWGMRICFVPDDDTELEPTIVIKEAEEDEANF